MIICSWQEDFKWGIDNLQRKYFRSSLCKVKLAVIISTLYFVVLSLSIIPHLIHPKKKKKLNEQTKFSKFRTISSPNLSLTLHNPPLSLLPSHPPLIPFPLSLNPNSKYNNINKYNIQRILFYILCIALPHVPYGPKPKIIFPYSTCMAHCILCIALQYNDFNISKHKRSNKFVKGYTYKVKPCWTRHLT